MATDGVMVARTLGVPAIQWVADTSTALMVLVPTAAIQKPCDGVRPTRKRRSRITDITNVAEKLKMACVIPARVAAPAPATQFA
jgi:hypothetical protein